MNVHRRDVAGPVLRFARPGVDGFRIDDGGLGGLRLVVGQRAGSEQVWG